MSDNSFVFPLLPYSIDPINSIVVDLLFDNSIANTIDKEIEAIIILLISTSSLQVEYYINYLKLLINSEIFIFE